jgi:acyl-CoA thioester hydrolase
VSATLADFPVQVPVEVRWADVDMYGHVNNAVYYQWFDTAINDWLRRAAAVDPTAAAAVGVVGESGCSYESQVRFGDEVVVGLAVAALGTSSITYTLGAFNLSSHERAALAHWVHVYVDRAGSTVPVPEAIADLATATTAPVPAMAMRKLPVADLRSPSDR